MTYFITPTALRRLEGLINELEQKVKKLAIEKTSSGAEQDGFHDEGFRMLFIEERMWLQKLGELQKLYKELRIVEPEEQNEHVDIGTGVVVEYDDGSIYKLVVEGYIPEGQLENCISIYSPLGQAILGAKKGEEKRLKVGDQEKTIKVVEILFPSVAQKELLEEEEND